MSIIMDGYGLAKQKRMAIKKEVESLKNNHQRVPSLTVIMVGHDEASLTYVNSKQKQAREVGFESDVFFLEEDVSEKELIKIIEGLNLDDSVDGILVQLPLPSHMNENKVIESIDPLKDVDGLHPLNLGYLALNQEALIPCTPKGIMSVLDHYNIELSGEKVLVIGRSRLVGKPVSMMLSHRNATVTLAHSKTKNLEALIKSSKIVVVAIGQKEFIKASWVHDEHVLIDVGIHRGESGLCGDVEKTAYEIAAYATPVPKGVGPMTVVSLLENTLESYKRRNRHE